MKRPFATFCALVALVLATSAHAADKWVEGVNYFDISPPQRTSVPAGKVEVAEVFSYGCPYCAQIVDIVHKLKASLPPYAQLVYLPASFIEREDWPMYQRAFFTAQALGILDKTHEAMFDAVWKTGELSYVDRSTNRIKSPLPSIEDAAKWYARTAGVKEDAFLAASKSFGVETKMKATDSFINNSQALSTPTFIVNGKYRLNAQSAGSYEAVIELVKFLVAKEGATLSKNAAAAAPVAKK